MLLIGTSDRLPAQDIATSAGPIKARHVGAARAKANSAPRSEGDQAIVDGWPLYRTERGQAAFNAAMATLRATEGKAPSPAAFKGCSNLDCNLKLPAIGGDGWIPAGRLWVSPETYVLVVHSPRNREGQSYRRRPTMGMRVFVFHEFHNSSRNTDLYDTISSHKSSVFVPLYMSKAATDAAGRRFVTVVQVAPYDVISIHATSHGSAGPGVEVAKNAAEPLEPLQGLAGILLANIVKEATPRLKVVNHGGNEGLPMLEAYERRLAGLRSRGATPPVALPFVAASPPRIAAASGRLDELIAGRGASPRLAVAERALVPPGRRLARQEAGSALMTPGATPADEPVLVEPIRLAVRPFELQQGSSMTAGMAR